MADKFRRYASPYLPPGRIEDVVRKVKHLEKIGDVTEITGLLRSG
jgi:hypothetical protein